MDFPSTTFENQWAIKLLLIATVVGVCVYFWLLRSIFLDRIFIVFGASLGVFFVVFPDSATAIAQKYFRVGRGVDLGFYFYIIFSLILIIMLFTQARQNERNLTAVVRNLAIHQARPPSGVSNPAPSEDGADI